MDFCLISVPFGHDDEPEILPYENPSACPIGFDARHIAQARGSVNSFGVLYVTVDVPPTDDDDDFQAKGNEAFVFTVGADVPPTWVKVGLYSIGIAGLEIIVALSRTDEE